MKKTLILLAVLGVTMDLPAQNAGPNGIPPEPVWHMLLEPYFMLGNVNGNVSVGTLPVANIDESPGDVLNHLNFGFMLYAEAYSDKWMESLDFTYIKLSSDIPSSGEIIGGHGTQRELSWEIAVMKRIKPWLATGIAFQLNSVHTDLNVQTSSDTSAGNLSRVWVDPSFVVAVRLPVARRLTIRTRGNIGGFGIGSRIYWQLQAYADYRFSKLCQVSLGYRAIKIDYERGSGDDYYLYNVITFGPVVRLGFNF